MSRTSTRHGLTFHSALINCIIPFFCAAAAAAACFGSTNLRRVFSLCILSCSRQGEVQLRAGQCQLAGVWPGVRGCEGGHCSLVGMQEKIAAAYRKRFKLLSSFVSAICWHFNALKHQRPTSWLSKWISTTAGIPCSCCTCCQNCCAYPTVRFTVAGYKQHGLLHCKRCSSAA